MSLRPCLGVYLCWHMIHFSGLHSQNSGPFSFRSAVLRGRTYLLAKISSRFFPYDTPSFLFKFIIQKYTRIYGAGLRYTAARVCVLKISSAVCDVVCFYFSAHTTKLAVTPHPFNITLNFSSLALIYSWLIPKYQPLCSNLLQYNLTTCSVNKK